MSLHAECVDFIKVRNWYKFTDESAQRQNCVAAQLFCFKHPGEYGPKMQAGNIQDAGRDAHLG